MKLLGATSSPFSNWTQKIFSYLDDLMTRGWEYFLLELLIFFLGGLMNDAKFFTPDIHESIPKELLFGKPFCSLCILRTWRWDVYLTSMPCLDLRICQWTEVFHSEIAWNFRLSTPPKRGEEHHFREKNSERQGHFWRKMICFGLVYRVGRKKNTQVFGLELCSRGKGGRLNSLLKILVGFFLKSGTKLLALAGGEAILDAIFGFDSSQGWRRTAASLSLTSALTRRDFLEKNGHSKTWPWNERLRLHQEEEEAAAGGRWWFMWVFPLVLKRRDEIQPYLCVIYRLF